VSTSESPHSPSVSRKNPERFNVSRINILGQRIGQLRALTLYVAEKPYSFLVDPGAVISIVKEDVIQCDNWRTDFDWHDDQVIGITGHAIKFNQKATIPFSFTPSSQSDVDHVCFVCNDDVQIPPGVNGLLGVDFFDRCGASLDFKLNVIRIEGYEFPLVYVAHSGQQLYAGPKDRDTPRELPVREKLPVKESTRTSSIPVREIDTRLPDRERTSSIPERRVVSSFRAAPLTVRKSVRFDEPVEDVQRSRERPERTIEVHDISRNVAALVRAKNQERNRLVYASSKEGNESSDRCNVQIPVSRGSRGSKGTASDKCFVRTMSSVTIPPYSELLCAGLQDFVTLGDRLIEPEEVKVHGISVARVVVRSRESREVQMKLKNASGVALSIQKNTILGISEPLVDSQKCEGKMIGGVGYAIDKSIPGEFESYFQLDHLTEELKRETLDLLREYIDIFMLPGTKLGCTSKVKHSIDVKGHPPIAVYPFRVPHGQKKIMKEMIDKLLADDIIEHSSSPWSAPVILISKAGNATGVEGVRLVVDFRKLNAVTKRDYYPIPNLQEVLDKLGQNSLFSTLDFASGYHQIALASEEDREKTGFATMGEHYMYKRLPFGLHNAVSTWMRLANNLLTGLTDNVSVYLDDVICFSSGHHSKHYTVLRNVFDRIREANLKLKPSKCHFLVTETKYLGYVINQNGVKPDAKLLETIRNFPAPKNVKEIKTFIGLIIFYSKFIANCSNLTAPINRLTRKDTPFVWSDECQTNFEILRSALTSDSLLCYPNFDKPFILATDASNMALGAVLSQEINGEVRPISYASRALNKHEVNYSTTELECLALVWATKFYRCYLYNSKHPWIAITDHASLQWLKNLKDPTSKLSRWALTLSAYDYVIQHRPGRLHANADAMSRIPQLAASAQYLPVWDRDRIKSEQMSDAVLKPIITSLLDDSQEGDGFSLDDDGLLYKMRSSTHGSDPLVLVVPNSMRNKVMTTYHSLPMAGHQGYAKTLELIRSMFFWSKMSRDIKTFCEQCMSCQLHKKSPHVRKAPLERIPIPPFPFAQVSCDVVGPITPSSKGYRYILTFQDTLSRYIEIFPIRDQKATTIAKKLVTGVIVRHGAPRVLLSDMGSSLLSQVMKETCSLLKIKKIQTTPYYPQANGKIERMHRSLKQILSHFISADYRDWPEWLPYIRMAYHSTIHAALKGYTPNQLVFGREIEFPFDTTVAAKRARYDLDTNYAEEVAERLRQTFEIVRKNLLETGERQKKQFDKKTSPVTFKAGAMVLMDNPVCKPGLSRKLRQKYTGPYEIVEARGPVTFKIKDVKTRKELLIHANRLKHCKMAVGEQEVDVGDDSDSASDSVSGLATQTQACNFPKIPAQSRPNHGIVNTDLCNIDLEFLDLPEIDNMTDMPDQPVEPRYRLRSAAGVEDLPWIFQKPSKKPSKSKDTTYRDASQ
jgi:transposase InsO family protein